MKRNIFNHSLVILMLIFVAFTANAQLLINTDCFIKPLDLTPETGGCGSLPPFPGWDSLVCETERCVPLPIDGFVSTNPNDPYPFKIYINGVLHTEPIQSCEIVQTDYFVEYQLLNYDYENNLYSNCNFQNAGYSSWIINGKNVGNFTNLYSNNYGELANSMNLNDLFKISKWYVFGRADGIGNFFPVLRTFYKNTNPPSYGSLIMECGESVEPTIITVASEPLKGIKLKFNKHGLNVIKFVSKLGDSYTTFKYEYIDCYENVAFFPGIDAEGNKIPNTGFRSSDINSPCNFKK